MNVGLIRKITWGVDLALVVALGFAAASVLGDGPKASGSANANITSQGRAAAPSRQRLTDEEAKLILTGGAIVPPPASPKPPTQVGPPEDNKDAITGFSFELFGTAVEKGKQFAFLRDTSTGGQVCKAAGDQVADAKIIEVQPDRVLIERSGKQGYLWRVKQSDNPPPEAPPATAPQTAAPANADFPNSIAPPAGEQAANGQPGDQQEPEAAPIDADQMVMSEKAYRDYLQNMGVYLNQISTRSHQGPDNNIDGLQLVKVPTTSEAYKRGFREGDVVKSLQGQPVTDVTAAMKIAYDVLKNQDYVVDVVLVRNGQEEVLTYEIWPE